MDRATGADDQYRDSGPGASGIGLDDPSGPADTRIRAAIIAARHFGVQLEATDYRGPPGEDIPSPAALVGWLRDQGLVAKALRLKWRNIVRLTNSPPIILTFRDGSAGVLTGADPARGIVWLRDPRSAESDPPVAVDELRLSHAWAGEVILVRRARDAADAEPPFNLRWLIGVVLKQKKSLRDIMIASITLSVVTIVPALLVMVVVDRVVEYRSLSTLVLLATILIILTVFETLLGYARREIVQVVSTRLDAELNLHVFSRLLALPVDYFERNQAGRTVHRLGQVYRVRDFLTGRVLTTFLDLFTLVILIPLLFWLDPTLTWMVIGCAGLIAIIIALFLPAVSRLAGKVAVAEAIKGSVMVETVVGIRTVKTLALEPQRKSEWDEKVAVAGQYRLDTGRLSNIPQTIITPLESFIQRGVILVGAYIALSDKTGVAIGALIAFMMLGQRVASPLVGIARMMEDVTEVRAALAEAGEVLNNPTETRALTTGMRPRLDGALAFTDLSFTYPGGASPALDRVNFEVPAGTMLGVVGRSGSGKSTLTRLLQGISKDYKGSLKVDGAELREINLTHLRRSLGVVMQDNFLFRGTVRDNIAAGRPGITLEDVVRAARLAGAEEFIERLPQGYETFIEEGSANISGGQKQRLAIARAVITDPRVMILDEATSALDPESEALVNANLKRIAKGRTMFIVSHRLSSLLDCDQILVMERGAVADIAPHNILLERCVPYRQLWLQQNRHMDQSGRTPPAAPALAHGDD